MPELLGLENAVMYARMPRKHRGMHDCVHLLAHYLLTRMLPSNSCLQWALTALLMPKAGRKPPTMQGTRTAVSE